MKATLEVIHNGLEDIGDPEINTLKQSHGTLRVPLEFKIGIAGTQTITEWTVVLEATGDEYDRLNVYIEDIDGPGG